MKAIHKQRLLKLAKHLRSGKLGHKKFDFGELNTGGKPSCGTAGCALGECPIIFPRYWSFSEFGLPELKVSKTTWAGARSFFGLRRGEDDHLFCPHSQTPLIFGGKPLGNGATAKQVAANIESFVKIKSNK